MNKEKWVIRKEGFNKENVAMLMEGLNIDGLTASVLLNRKIDNIEDAKKFLFADIESFIDPYEMKDMKKGVLRVKKAIENGEKITIYGDYDCDGVISTTILHKGFERCGANFNYHIPDRKFEGYGMNSERVKILSEEGTKLIVTCDNGIAAFEEISLANKLGMEVVLTDHHEVQFVEMENGEKVKKTPDAYAVIDQKQEECNYGFKALCGAGIALKFIIALYREMGIAESEALELMEFCAIATVCDIVDLTGENRIIVKRGLKLLTNSNNLGINALKEACNLKDKDIEAYHLGFVIGPCINATGRLESANNAVELLLTKDYNRAKELAKLLVELNNERKALTEVAVEEVVEQIEKEKLYKDKVLLVYNPNIHESIAGIVAGRVKEKYNLPTIVMTNAEKDTKGSARSIEIYDMFEELSKCKHLMEKFGGHPMAAGLSAKLENLPKLRKLLNDNCTLTNEELIPKVKIDKSLAINNVSEELLKVLNRLEPFGKGNATPVLAAKKVLVTDIKVIGDMKNHAKLICNLPNSNLRIEGLCFNKADELREAYDDKFGNGSFDDVVYGKKTRFFIDIIYKPSVNVFRGVRTMQMMINNFKLSDD